MSTLTGNCSPKLKKMGKERLLPEVFLQYNKYPLSSTSPLLASLCAKRRSRLLDDGRHLPLTWEIKPITGGRHGGGGLNQQHTFLLPARLAVLCALITQSSKTFTPSSLPMHPLSFIHPLTPRNNSPTHIHKCNQVHTTFLLSM